MSQIIIRFLIPALIPIVLGVLMSYMVKSNDKELIKNLSKNHVILRLPKLYLWVGFIDVFVFTFCLFLMYLYPDNTAYPWVVYVLSVPLELIGIYLIVATLTWKVEVFRDKDYFIYRTVFGRKYKIKYDECVECKYKTNTFILKTQNKTFYIDQYARNFEYLTSRIKGA